MLYPVELRGQAVSHKEHVVSSKQSIRALPRFLPTFTTAVRFGLGAETATREKQTRASQQRQVA